MVTDAQGNPLVLRPTGPVYPGEFLRVITGSTLSGLNVDPNGDRDETGVCIELPEFVTGLTRYQAHTWRSQPEGVPSGPGDADVTVYGLRHWMALAVKGNPNIHLLMFAPAEFRIISGLLTDDLVAMAPHIVSRHSAGQYLGYLTAQRERLLGESGGRKVQRPKNDRGYDGKYACHMVRLGFQGVELMNTGRITLPMPEDERNYCISIRKGQLDLNEILTTTEDLEARLKELRTTADLPETPDLAVVNSFLHDCYMWDWKTIKSVEALRT